MYRFAFSLAVFTVASTAVSGSGASPVSTPDAVSNKVDRGAVKLIRRQPVVELRAGPARPLPGERPERRAVESITLSSDVPALHVSTAGPNTMVVGQTATYEVTVRNQNDGAARDVAVGVALPSWVELAGDEASQGTVLRDTEHGRLTWRLDAIDGRARQRLKLRLIPRAGRAFDLNVDVAVRPEMAAARISVQEPKLHLRLESANDLVYGQTANWQALVANPGTGDAHDVRIQVRDGDQPLAEHAIGTIPAGTQRVVHVRLQPRDVGGHELHIAASAELGLTAAAKHAYLVRRGRLEMDMNGPAFEYAGTRATHELRVRNTGDAAVQGVDVVVDIPAGASYFSGMESAKVTPSSVQWQIGRLAAGEEAVFHITSEVHQAGELEFQARARTTDQLYAEDSLITRAESIADLKLNVLDPKGPQHVDETAEYEIQVINRGTAAARQVAVIAVCSPELEPVDVSGNAAVKSGQIFFRPIGQLQPGHKVVYKVVARANTTGSHNFRVIVQCYSPETRLAAEETTRFFARDEARRLATAPTKTSRR